MLIPKNQLRYLRPGDLPNSQLMPIAIPKSRRYFHCLRAVGSRVNELYAVWTSKLQGQVCVLLATGPKAEDRTLSKPLQPEMASETRVKTTWLPISQVGRMVLD